MAEPCHSGSVRARIHTESRRGLRGAECWFSRSGRVHRLRGGSIRIGGHTFHDHAPYGLLRFQEILEHSSNIGAVKLGMRLGESRLYQSLRTFGFGARTGTTFRRRPSASAEIDQWSALSLASISFGQEVAVTSMQILTAINAIANGGYRVRPSLVDRVLNGDGEPAHVTHRKLIRILGPETALQ